MSSKKENSEDPGLREEYDFSEGERGKYADRYADSANVIVLDPDVADFFRDAKAVNEALRLLARSAQGSERTP